MPSLPETAVMDGGDRLVQRRETGGQVDVAKGVLRELLSRDGVARRTGDNHLSLRGRRLPRLDADDGLW